LPGSILSYPVYTVCVHKLQCIAQIRKTKPIVYKLLHEFPSLLMVFLWLSKYLQASIYEVLS